jgi:hypothetical protein
MRQLSITPSITVTIGRHTRQYFAFGTTVPVELDTPPTVTLHAGPFAELVGLGANPFIHDRHGHEHAEPLSARRRDGTRVAAGEIPRARTPTAAGRSQPPPAWRFWAASLPLRLPTHDLRECLS